METVNIGTFTARRGDTFTIYILGELDENDNEIPLANYGPDWRSQLRVRHDSATSIAFAVDADNLHGLARDAAQLILSLTPEQTAAMAADSYVFDVEVSGNGTTNTLYEGTVRMTSDVTR